MTAKQTFIARARPIANRREAPRHDVTVCSATVRPHAAGPEEAQLGDVSLYGCKVACAGAWPAGERVWLRLAGSMPIAATVVWSEGGLIGCRFDQAIDRRLLRSLTLPVH